MRIIRKGVIPMPDEPVYNSNTFPCIVRLPSGRWLAACKTATVKADCDYIQAVITWSDDEGASWSPPMVPFRLPDVTGMPGQTRIITFLPLGGTRVLLTANWVDASRSDEPYYDPIQETLKDTRIFYSFSDDSGAAWAQPRLMKTDPITAPTPLTGPPVELADGTILCPFEINKSIGDRRKWIHQSAAIFSADQGRTWSDPVIITEQPDMYYWDQRLNVMGDGRTLVDFFWTLDGVRQQYLNIHGRESLDGGRTWGAFWDTGIYGQPGQPVALPDGRLAAIEIDRSTRPVITVRISEDRGRTFTDSLVIHDASLGSQDSGRLSMNDAWDEMYAFSVGHPNVTRLNDQEILAYYYAGSHADHTRIEFVRIVI